ncbi:MAG: SoxR reducing system RseC family protein, partial [Gammaproteobacteria bacterium]|nr:SoxR reducing system RseC family protein [Gammaproteobacteria bacterium]
MTEEQALVVEVNGDYAIIETMRKSTCGSCGVNQACGTSLLAKVIGNKRARVSARNTVGARVGET